MGRILCERHGRSSMVQVCPHLAAAVTIGTACPPFTSWPVPLEDADPEPVLELLRCAACTPARLDAETMWGLFEDAASSVPVCSGCFEDNSAPRLS